MDETTIITAVISAISQYFVAVRDKSLDKAASKTIGPLAQFVKGLFFSKKEGANALKTLEESPEDANALDNFRIHLEAALKSDPSLLKELQKFFPASQKSEAQISQIHNSPGSTNIQIQGSHNTVHK